MINLAEINWTAVLQSLVDSTTWQRGNNYYRHGKVVSITAHPNDGGVLLRARTLGSHNQIYEQGISISAQEGTSSRVEIDGLCSCPVGYSCKHVVAAVLKYQDSLSTEGSTSVDKASKQCLSWLDSLKEDAEKALDPQQDFIVYVVSYTYDNRLLMSLYQAKEKKRGGLTKGRQIYPDRVMEAYDSYYYSVQILPVDLEIAEILSALAGNAYTMNTELHGMLGGTALLKAQETGRLFWKTHQSAPLKTGDSRALTFSWRQQKTGDFKLNIQAKPKARIVTTEPPLYIDDARGEIGLLADMSLTGEQIKKLLAAPPVPESIADEFSQRLVLEHPELTIPTPKAVEIKELRDAKFRPHLTLLGQQLSDDRYAHFIMLKFDYDDVSVSAFTADEVSVVNTAAGYVKVYRDHEKELSAVSQLVHCGFMMTELKQQQELFFMSPADKSIIESASRWSEFLEKTVPELEQQGWVIETDDSFQLDFQEIQAWDAEIESSDNDWFEMRFNITINDQSLPLLPLITPVLEHYELDELPEILSIPLNEYRYVKIPSEQLKPFLEVLYELFDSVSFDADGNGKLSRYNAALLADLDEHSYGLFSMKGGEELIETGRKLKDFKGLDESPIPQGLKAQLRDYQKTGLNWLQFLREYNFAGILADDMGLGKTVQTLAHLLLEKESGRMDKPCLIVAPTSLISNWRREAERFTPDLKVLILQGADRKQKFSEIDTHDLVLTTYPLLPRDEEVLLKHDYYYLILDEAQIIKNPKAQASRIVRSIKAQHRLSLTGTPMENHLGELWAQFDFLMPGFLGDSTSFKKKYRTPIEIHGDAVQRERLAKRVKPFMLRRTKQEVVNELPEKTEIIRSVPLHDKQAALYESIRIAMEEKVRKTIAEKGLARSHITILDALLKLRQTCCDPRILSLQKAKNIKQSAKLDLLLELLDELLAEGRRVLVFSQFTKMLGLIEAEMKARKIKYTKLTGQTRKRDEAIERFKSGAADVFLISLKAGGVGLNLTEADTVIIYDPWWNPAVESQAADRVYRIGQDKAVFVYKLITEETVEEKIMAMQEKKRALAESVYQQGGKGETFELTADDLTDLFKPIG